MVWCVLAAIVAALFLIGLIRVGARVRMSPGGLQVLVRAGPAQIQVFPPAGKPKKPKKEKPKKVKPKKEKKPKPPKEGAVPRRAPTLGEKVELVRDLLPPAFQALGRLRRKIRIDRLFLHLVWGAPDPAEAAIGGGRINAALGTVWPMVKQVFHVKDWDLRAETSFTQPGPEVELDVQITLTIGQGVALAVRLGCKALMVFLQHRKRWVAAPA